MIMSKLLEDLYNGVIAPVEYYYDKTEEYKELREKYYKHCEDFIKRIGEPLKFDFNDILDEHNALITMANKSTLEGTFVDGFRLGAKMMLEILENK